LEETLEDTKEVIRSRKSKNAQCGGQEKKDRKTGNGRQDKTL